MLQTSDPPFNRQEVHVLGPARGQNDGDNPSVDVGRVAEGTENKGVTGHVELNNALIRMQDDAQARIRMSDSTYEDCFRTLTPLQRELMALVREIFTARRDFALGNHDIRSRCYTHWRRRRLWKDLRLEVVA